MGVRSYLLRGAACAAVSTVCVAQDDPESVALRAISKLSQQPYDTMFWDWAYGPAICMSAMYEVSSVMGQDWTRAVDRRLASFTSNSSSYAYMFLHNMTPPFDDAVGDVNGLMPIAYLSRFDYYNESTDSDDWAIAIAVADRWVTQWPMRLPDGTFSRKAGWPGQPSTGANFTWSDDQFMGLTLISRLAAHGAPNAAMYMSMAANMQVTYANHMQDPVTGLFYHGFDYATNVTSCCFWGRANGWVLMAHVEVLQALQVVDPNSPALPLILNILQRHAAAMATFQSADGRWYQVVNESSTFLETSVTSMTLYSLATAVMHGWLDKATYDPVIQRAWTALAGQVSLDGTVNGICEGTGILTSVADYNARGTDYADCQPGLGSVFRAALAFYQYSQTV